MVSCMSYKTCYWCRYMCLCMHSKVWSMMYHLVFMTGFRSHSMHDIFRACESLYNGCHVALVGGVGSAQRSNMFGPTVKSTCVYGGSCCSCGSVDMKACVCVSIASNPKSNACEWIRTNMLGLFRFGF